MRSVFYVVVLLLANYSVIVAPAAVSPRVFSFAASPQAQRKKEGGLSRKEKSPWFGAGLLAVPVGGGPKAGSRGAKGDDHYSPRKGKGRTAQPAAQTRRFQLPDLIAMSAAMERFKDYMRDINPRKTFEMICKDGECRMVEIKTAWAKWNDMMKDVPPPPKDGKKRVLILMSDTGGGHRASAQALDRSLSEQFPGKINVTIMDIWTDHAQPPFNKFVPVYRYLAKNPLLWRGFYLWGLFPPSKMFTEIWSWQNSYKSFKKAIACSHPDLVVSVHPLCQLMPIWAVEEINKVRDKSKFPVNFVTVVTDLGGAHKTWFDRRADKVFIPSMAVKKVASANRIVPDKIVLRGLPIRPAFWKLSKPKCALRRRLGLEDKSKMVLVMGGGDGVGGLGKIVIEIADRLGKAKSMQGQKSQVVVICGNNKKLVQQLQAKKYHDSVRVVVKGFVGTSFCSFCHFVTVLYCAVSEQQAKLVLISTPHHLSPTKKLRQRRRVHGGQ